MGVIDFQQVILAGISDDLPKLKPFDKSVSHAPKRKDILSVEEKRLALRNALRYFPQKHHAVLAKDRGWRLSPAFDLSPTPMIALERRDLAMTCGRVGRYANREIILS